MCKHLKAICLKNSWNTSFNLQLFIIKNHKPCSLPIGAMTQAIKWNRKLKQKKITSYNLNVISITKYTINILTFQNCFSYYKNFNQGIKYILLRAISAWTKYYICCSFFNWKCFILGNNIPENYLFSRFWIIFIHIQF